MSTIISKPDAYKLIDRLPDDATWDDLIHELYVREVIEQGLKDSETGKTKDVAEIRRKYGLAE
jgi:hypothetical protein